MDTLKRTSKSWKNCPIWRHNASGFTEGDPYKEGNIGWINEWHNLLLMLVIQAPEVLRFCLHVIWTSSGLPKRQKKNQCGHKS